MSLVVVADLGFRCSGHVIVCRIVGCRRDRERHQLIGYLDPVQQRADLPNMIVDLPAVDMHDGRWPDSLSQQSATTHAQRPGLAPRRFDTNRRAYHTDTACDTRDSPLPEVMKRTIRTATSATYRPPTTAPAGTRHRSCQRTRAGWSHPHRDRTGSRPDSMCTPAP